MFNLRSALCMSLFLFTASSAQVMRAQNINCQYGGKDDPYCNPSSGSNSSGNNTHEASPSDIAIHNCLFHGKCWPKKKKPASDAPPQLYVPSPTVSVVDDSQRRQAEADAQAATASRAAEQARLDKLATDRLHQQAFDIVKDSRRDGMKEVGDPDVVDLSRVDLNHATIPLHIGGDSAWVGRISDPSVAEIAKKLASHVPPPPFPREEVSLRWKRQQPNAEMMQESADHLVAVWDMTGLLGETALGYCKVILIAGKTFIAGEDGAYVHLVRQDALYEDALRYLKDPVHAKQFAYLVQEIKEGHPDPPSADPAMLKAARAITDPRLGGSGTRIAWDSMLSPEARAAMVRKAALEIGIGYISGKIGEKTEDFVTDLSGQRIDFEAVLSERNRAVRMLSANGSRLNEVTRSEIQSVVDHANSLLTTFYVQESATKFGGNFVEETAGELLSIPFEEEKQTKEAK